MLGAAKGEPQKERGRKAAKRLEIGPSEREHVESAVAVLVPGALEELMALVVHVVKIVDEIEVGLAGSQMPAAEVVLGMRVWESQRLILVENVLEWDVATHEVAVAVQWSESEAKRSAVVDETKRQGQVPLVESDAMAVAEC